MKIISLYIQESTFNKSRHVLIATAEDGQKWVVAGEHHGPTYLMKYEDSPDTQ